ncbi:MAG: phosphonopyruvate decarboxylase [Gammaproteobacteria bacterium]|nr:phosphonopyruvate decarboxylase [Gammaproteobacteria bacterium]NNM00529.1 phosphonopyruvate decarboxylase [Gammaproteobacteria bacterium]
MIEAQEFVEPARAHGFAWYAGVPCSFLTPFINYVINDPALSYISSANEGDAVATASGLALGGHRAVAMMQNSGLGNAVSPLTSLNYVFRLPVLLICTHRGAPDVKDEPQHALMGQITSELFDTMRIPWRPFPADAAEIEPVLSEACDYLDRERRPFALLMRKGTVAPHTLTGDSVPERDTGPALTPPRFTRTDDDRVSRREALQRVIDRTHPARSLVVATTGFTGRELYALADRPNQLYMVGSMGCAASLGLGLALARPDRETVVVDGDGSALMRMGNFATLGSYAPDSLTHIVLDNGVHDSTGAQATVSANVDFATIAAACGYRSIAAGDDPDMLERFIAGSLPGPRFLHLKIRPGAMDDLPRPSITPEAVADRIRNLLGTA